MSSQPILLSGFDAANPLAMLATLGCFRLVTDLDPDARLAWRCADAWRPELHTGISRDDLPARIAKAFFDAPWQAVKYNDIVAVPPAQFREAATGILSAGNTLDAELMAAFASDGITNEKNVVPSLFSFSNGGSGKCLFKDFRTCAVLATTDKLDATLFRPWQVIDDVTSLCWDPADQRAYALQWRDPAKADRTAEAAANALAFVGLACLPSMPHGRGLATAGFGTADDDWTWPVWTTPLLLAAVKSLLTLAALQSVQPDRVQLARRGVAEIYRCRRFSANKRFFFSPAKSA